jgi:hypothetical protein
MSALFGPREPFEILVASLSERPPRRRGQLRKICLAFGSHGLSRSFRARIFWASTSGGVARKTGSGHSRRGMRSGSKLIESLDMA